MAGVDQAQIDKILAGVSSDDPEARLDALEKELDFVKTSIKRLLIDLRERLNELDNPFTSSASVRAKARSETPADTPAKMDDEKVPDTDAAVEVSPPAPNPAESPPMARAAAPLPGLPAAGAGTVYTPPPAEDSRPKPPSKLKLQKVHRLFEWVNQGCSRYGRERMSIMIDAYQSMGYISEDVAGQIREIMRMVADTSKVTEEIGPNEFVSELYVLNRILDPEDSTLDREMIEVLMHSRRGAKEQKGEPQAERDAGDTWAELLDRI
ncbi:FlaD/FlaE family flagellar protein [Methanoculleus receptaculi]|uniref:FlaD/FlaE family flagellar protein n=1 Tax=Methanoculleus receptaculi TaxID=394967 RepID=A0AAX4FTM9_9EURY|nr:FlaD/FlaE family flagellar protein [Methanoculleus receptaculi]WOX57276.1 FlaD/FlaE family flagellar protein [Methanoculleus receptaculi]